MIRFILISVTTLGLVAPAFHSVLGKFDNPRYIDTALCVSGQIIRIPTGEDERDQNPDNMRACHALCSRDSDEETMSSERG